MGKRVRCLNCGSSHYMFLKRDELPHYYCPVQGETVILLGRRPALRIKNPGNLDEPFMMQLRTTFEAVGPGEESRCLVCGGKVLGMLRKRYGEESVEAHLERHGFGNEVRP